MDFDLKDYAVAAARRMLRPALKMLLKHGVMHSEVIELTKEIYVDIARDDYGLRGRPTNVSRVALLTGLGRKEATRIKNKLQQTADGVQAAGKQDRIARVLAAWYQDADYVNGAGEPLALPLEGPTPSFQSLVARYGGDVPAITLQREMQRVEALRLVDGKVEVLRRNYRLATADPEALTRSGSVMADLGRTVMHNLYHEPDEESRFEARASNINIPTRALPAYREFIYTESQRFLETVDTWLTKHEGAADEPGSVRLGVGMYWIQDDDPTEAAKS